VVVVVVVVAAAVTTEARGGAGATGLGMPDSRETADGAVDTLLCGDGVWGASVRSSSASALLCTLQSV
jgi:hypothetical protein